MAKQALGPNQEKWLAALESGNYKQGQEYLYQPEIGYCCLGVACDLVGLKPDLGLYNSDSAARFLGVSDFAPPTVIEYLALRGSDGTLSTAFDQYESLAEANDDGKTFAEIAAFCRENPESVFTEPK